MEDTLVIGTRTPLKTVWRNLVIGVLACTVLMFNSLDTSKSGPALPFVWTDLALTYFAASWIWGRELVKLAVRSGRLWISIVLCSLVLVVGLLSGFSVPGLAAVSWLQRMTTAVVIVIWSQAIGEAMLPAETRCQAGPLRRPQVVWRWGFAVATALLVPLLYEFQRVENGLKRLGDRIDQQRLLDAQQIAAQILAVSPRVRYRQQSLRLVEHKLRKELTALQAEYDTLTSQSAEEPAVTLQRAILLAMLGRSAESESLASCAAYHAATRTEAYLLLGTLTEERDAWYLSRDWYRQAYRLLQTQSGRDADVIRALNGIAFAERKLGNRSAADVAYRTALDLAPTAAAHFLLAQFYEDIQRPTDAANHAREAIRLEPATYRLRGETLIERLAVHHAGCWSVSLSRREAR